MLITNIERIIWWYQTSHRNRVTIKVDLGTLKALVEAHRSKVGFVHPDDEKIYSGPSQWYCIDTACKHVTRSPECHITERVKSACRERDWTRYGWYQMIGSWKSNISRDKRNWLRCSWFTWSLDSSLSKWESLWISRSCWWLLIGEASPSCPCYLWWHTYVSMTHFEWIWNSDRIIGQQKCCFRKTPKLFWDIKITQGVIVNIC
jgi:hypothetical protein